jgi:hypothetical protein
LSSLQQLLLLLLLPLLLLMLLLLSAVVVDVVSRILPWLLPLLLFGVP